jgi:hypothetical protein
MDTKPYALTNAEINEIAAIGAVQQMWGAETSDDMAEILQHNAYAVRFDFISGSPGYCGDVFLIIGDALTNPLMLIRVDGRGSLKIVEWDE